MSLYNVTDGDTAYADAVQQVIDLLKGVPGRGAAVLLTALSDAAVYGLTIENQGAGSKGLQVLSNAGAVLLQVDGTGVLASPDGVAAAGAILTSTSTIYTPFDVVTLTNQSGVTVAAGDLVTLDAAHSSSFTASTTQDDVTVLGVMQATSTANLATGRVAVLGVATVAVVGATSRGQWLSQSTTSRQARATTYRTPGSFARAMTSTGGAGTVTAVLCGPAPKFTHQTIQTTTPLTITDTDEISDMTVDKNTDVTVTLPLAANNIGRDIKFEIVNVGHLILTPNGTDKIQGVNAAQTFYQWDTFLAECRVDNAALAQWWLL